MNPFVAPNPDPPPALRALSLGAGVQSTTLALMAAHGEIGPPPDVAIFADTGAEPTPVYDHLRWLQSGNVLPFPVRIVSAGNLRHDLVAGFNTTGHHFASIPYHLKNLYGKPGISRRQCTSEYKLKPIAVAQRQMLGIDPGRRVPKRMVVEVWIGISTDEIQRVKPSTITWQRNRWPLIERGMSRRDCLKWLSNHGYMDPPKSACTFCPYRSNAEWRWLRAHDPRGWQEAIETDAALRATPNARGLRAVPFVHRSLVPLAEANIETDQDERQLDLWNNECAGMCGV